MNRKMLSAFIIGICLLFFSTTAVFAELSTTEVPESMIEKQREIDKYVFDDHEAELFEKGITVTHTAPSESSVEIGILPYTEENIAYFEDLFGKDNITLVDGQMAVTMKVDNVPVSTYAREVPEKNNFPLKNLIYLSAAIVVLTGVILIYKKKTAKR